MAGGVDPAEKLSSTVRALYGAGVERRIPGDLRFEYSRTGRIRGVYGGDTLLCTLRPDGGLALSIPFAQALLGSDRFSESCVEVGPDAVPFVECGRSVFAKHVTRCGGNVAVSADTPVVHRGRVIAVGRAVLSADTLGGCRRGVAVRVRKGLKGGGEVPRA